MTGDRSALASGRRGRPPLIEPVIDIDELDDPRLGIADPALARIVWGVFSTILGSSTGQRPYVTLVNKILAGAGRVAIRQPDGRVEPAPFPDLPVLGFSRAVSVDRRIAAREGQPPDLTRLFLDAQEDGVYATLSLRYVCQYFLPSVWPVAALAIGDWGPAETQRRIGLFIAKEAKRPVRHGKRKGELLSDGTLYTFIEATSVFLRAVRALYQGGYCSEAGVPAPELAQWAVLPPPLRLPRPGPRLKRVARRQAPPLALVRQTLRELDSTVAQRLATRVGREGCLRLYRQLVLLAIVAVLGIRIGSAARLRVGSYERKHEFPDGEIGPALLVEVEKNGGIIPRWKALPEEVAAWLEGYLDYTGLRAAGPLAPLWIYEWETPRAFGKPKLQPMSATSLTETLLDGYSAHELRHLSHQLAVDGGDVWLDGKQRYRGLSAKVFAELLHDHQIHCDPLFYNDLNAEDGRERWGRRAALAV